MAKSCLVCGKRAYSDYCVNHKPRKPIEVRKPLVNRTPIKKQGKRSIAYEDWKKNIARPFLEIRDGKQCSQCFAPPPVDAEGNVGWHDVDHIKNRSTHPELKMVLSNVRFLCRACHSKRV